jgi:hypothetical protein
VRKYYLSAPRFTVQVNTDAAGIIRWTAPVSWKFVGQPFGNLVRWSKADVVEEIGPVTQRTECLGPNEEVEGLSPSGITNMGA